MRPKTHHYFTIIKGTVKNQRVRCTNQGAKRDHNLSVWSRFTPNYLTRTGFDPLNEDNRLKEGSVMRAKTTSTIAALCYKRQIDLDFSVLVSEFDNALIGNWCQRSEMPGGAGSFVTFTMGDILVCLAHSRRPQTDVAQVGAKYNSSIVISVGSTHDDPETGPLFDKRWELCGTLIGRVEELHRSDHDIWAEIDGVFTQDICEGFISALWEQSACAPKLGAGQWPYLKPDQILPDLDRRLVDEFTRAGTPRPSESDDNIFRPSPQSEPPRNDDYQMAPPVADAPMTATPVADTAPVNNAAASAVAEKRVIAPTHPALHADKPKRRERPKLELPSASTAETESTVQTGMIVPTHPALHADRPRRRARPQPAVSGEISAFLDDNEFAPNNLHIYREALYPPEELLEQLQGSKPLPQRLTIYTMNVTLIAISAPVGAAMMTYSVLGREDMSVMARAMALTGTAIGLAKAGLLTSLLPLLG